MSTQITINEDVIDINVTEEVIVIEAPSGAYPLPTGVFSVFGRTGNVVAQDGDYNLTDLGDVAIVTPSTGQVLRFNGTSWVNSTESYVGTVTSVDMTVPTGLTVSGNPITTSGTLEVGLGSGYVIPTQDALDAKVPYTGATTNVDLGTYGLISDYAKFNTSPSSVPTTLGTLSWDSAYRTLQLIDGDGDTTLQIGQEQRALIHNNTGVTLTDGQVVYVTGSTGNLPTVALASNALESTSSVTFGVVTESIANGADGFVTITGNISGLDTLAFNEGDALYLGATPGTFTNVKPIAPANLVLVGYVIKKAGGNGSIFVKIQNGYELEELHDVLVTSVANNQGIFWDSATSLWKNKSVDTALGYTPVPTTRTITINGLTQDLSADRTYTLTTTNVAEGTNQYFTNTRARAAISETVTGLDYNNTTGVFSTTAGYGIPTTASQANWDTAYTNRITSASAPLSIASNAISISQANSTTNGFLSSTDWNTFNNKQAAGNYITSLTGEATASGPGAASVTLTNSAVTGKVLTGLNVTGGSVSATDSLLTAFGKVQNQINGLIGGSIYQSVWNASTNTPTLASGVGTKGYYYIVNVAGTTNLDGITDWQIGDWAIYDGTAWQKVDNTDAVSSVNGFTGAVSLTTDNVSEGTTNLYFTNARAQNAITLTTTGTSGAATYSGGTLNIPQYQSVLTNPVTGTGTTNTLPKFTGTSAIGNSNITDTGSLITLGSNSYVNGNLAIGANSAPYGEKLYIQGDASASSAVITTSANSGISTLSINVDRGLQGGVNIVADKTNQLARITVSNSDWWPLVFQVRGADGINERMRITNIGSVGIGATSLGQFNLRISKSITGSSTSYSIQNDGVVQSTVSTAIYNATSASTVAAAFTLTDLRHYFAQQGTFGLGSTVTNQYGFIVDSSFTSATNNYGFFGNIAAGTNRWNLYMNGTANNYMAGSLGIGSTSLTGRNLQNSKSLTGSVVSYAQANEGVIQSDVTTAGVYYRAQGNTAAATFTTDIQYYNATQGTFGAGSTITNQYGFLVGSTLIGATNNYGFFGSIPSGTNRWNLYMAGTAANYMAGSLAIGTTSITTKLSVITAAGGNTSGFSVGSTVGLLNIWGGASSGVVFDVTNGTLNGSTGTDLLFRQGGTTVMLIGSSQQVGIGATSINASAKLQVDSTTQGFLPPRMTLAQRAAIATPATGLMVYQTDGTEGVYVYTSIGWKSLTMV